MKLILTEKVTHLGNIGEVVNVSAGYGRNYLIPKSFAVVANDSNKKELDNHKKRLAKKFAVQKAAAEEVKAQIDGMTIELIKKVGNNGRLFGTVTNTELAAELLKLKEVEIERRLIIIENPIKMTGTFDVHTKIFTDVVANFKVKVMMDPAQAEEMKKKQEAIAAKKAAKAIADAEAAANPPKEEEETSEEVTSEEVEA